MNSPTFDVAIIGAGPGGYVCAIRAAQLGLAVALVEKLPDLGGTCLNVGCIPSKALLHSTELFHQASHACHHGIIADGLRVDLAKMMQRKNAVVAQLRKGVRTLVEKRGITIFSGSAAFSDPHTLQITGSDSSTTSLSARHIVIATGSVPVELPFLKADGRTILTSTEALELDAIPATMAVIGGGAIGLELGSVWCRLGTRVTVIEFLPTIAAGSDEDVSKLAHRIFTKQGMSILTVSRVTACELGASGATLTIDKNGQTSELSVEKVLLAVGRKPFTAGLQLDKAGLATNDKGRIPTSGLRTVVPHIWAIGDVVDGPMLAHKAEEDGVAVAEAIASGASSAHADYARVPNVIYTHPEIASIGITERTADELSIPVSVAKFQLAANGRAIAQDATDGMVKIIAHAKTDRLLGASIVAAGASEMIAAIAAHMEYGGSAEDLGHTIHAHPTISEAIKEASLAISKSAIHAL